MALAPQIYISRIFPRFVLGCVFVFPGWDADGQRSPSSPSPYQVRRHLQPAAPKLHPPYYRSPTMSETPSSPNPTIGQRVRIVSLPPYVKTADPMPMLRPPNVISIGDEGVILARQPGDTWSIRFAKGAYLLDRDYFELVAANEDTSDA